MTGYRLGHLLAVVLVVGLLGFGCGCGQGDSSDSGGGDHSFDDTAGDDSFSADDSDDSADGGDDVLDDDTAFETHPALQAADSVLPPGVDSCAVIAEQACRQGTIHRCAIYDPAASGFPASPPEFLERVYYSERYIDLYQHSENSLLTPITQSYMAPGVEESVWAAPENFQSYDDWGDGAFYGGMAVTAAAHRYAATGTPADYERMKAFVERQLNNWRVTGVPGYMVRSTAAMLDQGVPIPAGYPQYNLREYWERNNHVKYVLPPERYDLVPAYYYNGVVLDDSTHLYTTPVLEGSPSQDAYSGAIVGLQMAYDLLRPEDQALKEEIAEDVVCSLTRLKKMRIANLTGSWLGRLAVQYLTSAGGFHPDPDDIDLTQIDTMIGYVQEAIPPGDPGDFDFGCPAELPTEVDPKYDWDAASPLFLFQLLDFANRMEGQGDDPIDFTYFVSHRGGDVIYLVSYALFAYHATGDARFLDFIDHQLIGEVRGLEILNTAGSFYLNPYCGSWIGGDLSHPVIYATMAHLDQGNRIFQEHERAMKEEFKDKMFANDNNAYFGMTYSSVVDGAYDPDLESYASWAKGELEGYMLNADYPLDPKRNYNTDYVADPLPPPFEPSPPTPGEVEECNAGLEIFGITIIPGPGVDPDFQVLSRAPLPVERRVPHDLIWHFSPFNLRRDFSGRQGRAQMYFIDLTVPYWIGCYRGLIDSGAGMALAWQDTGDPCVP